MAMAVLVEGVAAEVLETAVRARSPRIMASAMMTVLPPSMMFCVPTSVAFRATLLPVSVSMYSPLGARLDMVGRGLFDRELLGQSRRRCPKKRDALKLSVN